LGPSFEEEKLEIVDSRSESKSKPEGKKEQQANLETTTKMNI
jgi:hypothetical protein